MKANQWQAELDGLIKLHVSRSRKSQRGKRRTVQEATILDREDRFHRITRELILLGMLPQSVYKLSGKHLVALVRFWESQDYSTNSLLKKLTTLRTLLEWTGKREALGDPARLFRDPARLRRPYIAPTDRSWSAHGVDVESTIKMVAALDPHVGMQLQAIHVFKLGRAEALRLKPWRADKGSFLAVSDGTRGRPDRVVGPLTPTQRTFLDELKQFVGDHPERPLSRPGLRLKQANARFTYILRKAGISRKGLGVTAYGLARERNPVAAVVPAAVAESHPLPEDSDGAAP